MAVITLRAVKGLPLTFQEVDDNFNAINQELITLAANAAIKGAITNADIDANAAIVDTKLATITAAGKVANSATTASSASGANLIVLRDANGDFSAGSITANLLGNASTASAFSGSRTITLTGATTGSASSTFAGNLSIATALAAGSVTNASVANNAAIADTKLATIATANKVSALAIDLDGANDIGQAVSDSTLMLVDSSGAGVNRKAQASRLPPYVFGKVSGDISISDLGVATVNPSGKTPPADIFALVSGAVTVSPTGVASLAAGTVFDANINASAAIAHAKLASLSAGRVLLGNSSNVPTATAISGDISLDSSGNATLANSGVLAGTYTKLTVDAKGRVTLGATLAASDIPALADANIASNANIAGAKINPDFGSQNVSTLGILTAGRLVPTGSTVPSIGLYQPIANALGFATNGTERIRIRDDGNIAFGGAGQASVAFFNQSSIKGGTVAYANWTNSSVQSDVTNSAYGYRTQLTTAAAAFTLSNLYHYTARQIALGATSAVTSQYGFAAESTLNGASNNYGFYGSLNSALGSWNFFANGTAPNYFAGDVRSNTTFSCKSVPANANTNTTASASSLLDGLRTGTPAANITLQVPTGANMDAAFQDLQANQAFEWSVINLASATHVITVTDNTDHALVGNMVVAAASSGRFKTRKTGANTFITYRLS
jgi:hypothetical protein